MPANYLILNQNKNKIRKNSRGKLIEIFKGKFAQCNLLSMKKGTVWGRHYHKKTTEYFYLLKGEVSISFCYLKTKRTRKMLFKSGDNFTIKPNILHTIYVLKLTECLVLYSRQFNKEKPDIYR